MALSSTIYKTESFIYALAPYVRKNDLEQFFSSFINDFLRLRFINWLQFNDSK